MNVTTAEYLPNELWLQVFSHLKNVDILYAFHMLNKRFQQIITPYSNNIDLSEASLKQFNTVLVNILSSEQDYHISSLTLKNSGQFQKIFFPYEYYYNYKNYIEIFSGNMHRIKTLTLVIDHWFHETGLFHFILKRLSYMPNLTDLHLNILFDIYVKESFCTILANLPSTLTKLTILGFWDLDTLDGWVSSRVQLSSNIKSFAFSMESLEAFYRSRFLEAPNNHIEELKISFEDFDVYDTYRVKSSLKFSTSLITLHLELLLLKLDILPEFLTLFPNQLKSLILIIRTTNQMICRIENELKNMVTDIFPVMETFQYTIYSSDKTITNSSPAPLSFSNILRSNWSERDDNNHFSPKKNQSLFDTTVLNFGIQNDLSKIRFLKLHKLVWDLQPEFDELSFGRIHSFNNLFGKAPNLKCLSLSASNSQTIIKLLKLIPTKTLTKLHQYF